MRVLFTTTPGRGHYLPMIPLADALRERGHEVSWVAHAERCGSLRDAGFEADEAGLPEGFTSAIFAEQAPELEELAPADRPDFIFSRIFGAARAGPMLEDLLPVVRSRRPSLLVCDQAEFAGPIAAALTGVPNVTHSFGHPLPEIRLERAAEEMAALWREHGLEPRPYAGAYDHLYLDIYPDSLKTTSSPHIGQIQALRPAGAEGKGDVTPDDPPLVYVTFGTVFNTDVDLIRTVVNGIRELPVSVLVTCGPGRDVGALGDQPANVEVAEFIPQAELLPRCATVVSHAGSGTFLAALGVGLPQLLLPQAADQFLNAAAGSAAGVGIAIDPDDISASAIRDAVGELLGSETYRAAARGASAEISAMPGPDAVAEELERRFG